LPKKRETLQQRRRQHHRDGALAPRNRVLMFAYYFPPLGGSGVQRILKYVKYLPSEGFDPIVVTGSPRWRSLVWDPAMTREVPREATIVRARTLPLEQVQGKVDGLLQRAGLPSRAVRAALWPDELVGWLPAAVWHGLRLARAWRPRVIYSTSLPATAHLAGLIVHRLTGLPWVADFRDAWTFDPGPSGSPYAPPARLVAALERRVIAEASYTTVACDSIQLLDLTSGDRRRVLIPNGVDPDDLLDPEPAPQQRQGHFSLSHVGSLYGSRDAGPVIASAAELIGRGVIDASRFELRLVGRGDAIADETGLVPVTSTGFVNHHEALAEMARATALLFHQPAEQLGSSGKIYEYLASSRPVLCVAHPDSIPFRLVQELRAGECADAREASDVARALERMLIQWRRGSLKVDPGGRDEALRRFSRRKLTGELAGVLRAAIVDGNAKKQASTGESAGCAKSIEHLAAAIGR
jgi:glycosyltransferase involved in cell wall biosynthesis